MSIKVTLQTPVGDCTVEVPPETESIRVGVYHGDEGTDMISVEIDACYTIFKHAVAKHLLYTEIVTDSTFGLIEDVTNAPAH